VNFLAVSVSLEASGIRESLRQRRAPKLLIIVALSVLAVVLFGISVTISGLDITFVGVFQTLYNHIMGIPATGDAKVDDIIIWNKNLPRAVFALFGGAALGVGGAVMQAVMRNPLADPYTTGVSSGASLGVSLAVILGFSVSALALTTVMYAFVMALVPMLVVLMLSPTSKTSPAALILIGIAIAYFFNAVNTVLLSTASVETLAQIYIWQVGSLDAIQWFSVEVVAASTAVGMVILILMSRILNVMSLNDKEAKSLGISVDNCRTILLVVVSFITAAVVSFAGIIGFIGLLVPHIVRSLIGNNNVYVIPASAAFGAVFLLSCDIAARLLVGSAMPVGVMVSFIGAPLFLVLILRNSKELW